MDLNLKNKVALVTGGSRGLGRAICLGLAAEGADVAINYRRDKNLATQLADAIRHDHDVEALIVHGDITDSDHVVRMFDVCQSELGMPDVLVNNAGIWPTAYVKDMAEEEWDHSLAVNLKSAFLTSREAVRRWLAHDLGGRIVNISTQAAFHG